jgi:hypothetical protein
MSGRTISLRAQIYKRALLIACLVVPICCAILATHALTEQREDEHILAAVSSTVVDSVVLAEPRSEPLRIEPLIPEVSLGRDWESIDTLSKRVWPGANDWLSRVVHGLVVFEPTCEPPDSNSPTWNEMRSVLLDTNVNKNWFGGQVSLVQTREGLRFISTSDPVPAASAHIDQCLAVLGGIGVSLDHPLYTPVGRGTLRNVLEDSVANFQLDVEVEWTAIAYTLYLPPQRSWQNKIGERFDFDMLATEIMSRSFADAPCKGTHGLYALTLMIRAHQLEPILSESCHQLVKTYLRNCVDAVGRKQLENGAFPGEWYADIIHQLWYWDIVQQSENNFSEEVGEMRDLYVNSRLDDGATVATERSGSEEDRGVDTPSLVQATGHHLEWMIMLPKEMQPDSAVFQRAAAYAFASLEQATDQQLQRDHCPYSHAARMLRLLGRQKASAVISGGPVHSVPGLERGDSTSAQPLIKSEFMPASQPRRSAIVVVEHKASFEDWCSRHQWSIHAGFFRPFSFGDQGPWVGS